MQTESLVSLGVMPVAHADGDAYNTWVANAQVDDSVKDVGKRAEPSVTEIMKADPELVIADSTSPEAIVKQLEDNDVPVLVLDTADAPRQPDLLKAHVTTTPPAAGQPQEPEHHIGPPDPPP